MLQATFSTEQASYMHLECFQSQCDSGLSAPWSNSAHVLKAETVAQMLNLERLSKGCWAWQSYKKSGKVLSPLAPAIWGTMFWVVATLYIWDKILHSWLLGRYRVKQLAHQQLPRLSHLLFFFF